MPRTVLEVLGEERINEICKMHNLPVEDRKIIYDILEKWEDLAGQQEEKLRVATKASKDVPGTQRKNSIAFALLQISLEFAEKQ